MDIKEIKAIVELMKRSSLTEFKLEEKDLKLKICRKSDDVQTFYQATTPVPFPPAQAAGPVSPAASPQGIQGVEPETAAVDESKLIKSPMVGTFYSSPSPESPPFVSVGDSITEDSVVCIIEAMKVMNEITADVKGKIAEILIGNGENVEYGQALFRIQ